jgi:hypothetical protein
MEEFHGCPMLQKELQELGRGGSRKDTDDLNGIKIKLITTSQRKRTSGNSDHKWGNIKTDIIEIGRIGYRV